MICKQINAGIADYLKRHSYNTIADLVGTMHTGDS